MWCLKGLPNRAGTNWPSPARLFGHRHLEKAGVVRSTLDDDKNRRDASRSRLLSLHVATLLLLWLAIMLAVVVVHRVLTG
jgi:hypothetical protein